MTITQLEYVVAVATYKSFVAAAEKCFVTQPTLSMQIQKLEDELGMKKEEIGVVSAYKQFVMRAYKVPEKMEGKSIAEIESEFSPERVFVEKIAFERA